MNATPKKINLKNLRSDIVSLKKNLLNLNFQKSTGQLENTSAIKKARRKLASLKTSFKSAKRKNKMPKRLLSGKVVSSKNNKSIVVEVTRRVKHKLYKKIIKKIKRYHAHDEANVYKIGDNVTIQETKPISKMKSWITYNSSSNIKESETK